MRSWVWALSALTWSLMPPRCRTPSHNHHASHCIHSLVQQLLADGCHDLPRHLTMWAAALPQTSVLLPPATD